MTSKMKDLDTKISKLNHALNSCEKMISGVEAQRKEFEDISKHLLDTDRDTTQYLKNLVE